jgi:RIO kinase 2
MGSGFGVEKVRGVLCRSADGAASHRRGGTYSCLKTLLKHKLVHHDGCKYDGFRLTYLGYDFLALRTMLARGTIAAVGRQIGVGKESDVFEVRRSPQG